MRDIDNLSISELADLLSPRDATDEDRHRLLRWLQSATQFDLLRPIGGKHGGRGVHRAYDQDEALKARVLIELDGYGFPTRQLQMVAEWLEPVIRGSSPRPTFVGSNRPSARARLAQNFEAARLAWQQAVKGKPMFLTLYPRPDGSLELRIGSKFEMPSGRPSCLTLNLGRMLKVIPEA